METTNVSLWARLDRAHNRAWIAVEYKTVRGEIIYNEPPGISYYALRPTKATEHNPKRKPEGHYSSLAEALQALENYGREPASPANTPAPVSNGTNGNGKGLLPVAEAAAKYLTETEANKAHKTWAAYRNTLKKFFLPFCTKRIVAEIDRDEMLAFKTYLKSQKLGRRSLYNNFLNTMVFMKWTGVHKRIDADDWIRNGDWPEKPERAAEEYTDAEVKLLTENVRDSGERLLLFALLCTGFRSGEMAHLTYGDINFETSVWRVQAKENHPTAGDWRSKNGEDREVPVPKWLTSEIFEHMTANGRQKRDLVFPNTENGPDGHLLRVVKAAAKKAGLNDIRVDDHKFRSTAITRWLRAGYTVTDVAGFAGHGDLKTIEHYAAAIRLTQPENRRKAENAFGVFSPDTADRRAAKDVELNTMLEDATTSVK